MVLGWNDVIRKEQVLGSGFLVSTGPELLALTATHIFTEWLDKVRPPKQHAFRGVQGDEEDFAQRFRSALKAGLFMAAIHCRAEGGYKLCNISGATLAASPFSIDVACIQLDLPEGTKRDDFDAVPINAEIKLPAYPMVMVGWSGGEWELPQRDGEAFSLRQQLDVRLAWNFGPVNNAPGFQNWMFRIDAPSKPGMSGGPLLCLDFDSSPGRVRMAARGVISRDFIAPTETPADQAARAHCEAQAGIPVVGPASLPAVQALEDLNQTWVSPIEAAYTLILPPPLQMNTFADAVRFGLVGSYGQRARRPRLLRRQDGSIYADFPD